MKKPSYAEARQNILTAAPVSYSLRAIDTETALVAAEALERANKQPAMKDHERIFFALCFAMAGITKPVGVVMLLSGTIPRKRCMYYLKKWHRLGFYSPGQTWETGRLYLKRIPQRYWDILKKTEE